MPIQRGGWLDGHGAASVPRFRQMVLAVLLVSCGGETFSSAAPADGSTAETEVPGPTAVGGVGGGTTHTDAEVDSRGRAADDGSLNDGNSVGASAMDAASDSYAPTDSDGADGSIEAEAGPTDVDAAPPTNDASPAACSTFPRGVCIECCEGQYPEGLKPYSAANYGCGCADCYGACADTLCNSNTPEPSAGCVTCLKTTSTINCSTGPCPDTGCANLTTCIDGCF